MYSINFSSILNYIYGDDEQPAKVQPITSAYKSSSNFENELDDDPYDFNLADKYKSKRDTQQRLNRYAFGLGKLIKFVIEYFLFFNLILSNKVCY